tara:strand:- start:952 stop:1344 length:393 start_codon:yes stop_codon:yes gene_type:complete
LATSKNILQFGRQEYATLKFRKEEPLKKSSPYSCPESQLFQQGIAPGKSTDIQNFAQTPWLNGTSSWLKSLPFGVTLTISNFLNQCRFGKVWKFYCGAVFRHLGRYKNFWERILVRPNSTDKPIFLNILK